MSEFKEETFDCAYLNVHGTHSRRNIVLNVNHYIPRNYTHSPESFSHHPKRRKMYKTSNSMKVNKQEKIIKAKWSDKENLFIPPAYPQQSEINHHGH